MSVVVAYFLLILLILLAALIRETWPEQRSTPAPGKLVRVNDVQLHLLDTRQMCAWRADLLIRIHLNDG